MPLNAVEHGPVPTRVLNPNSSEASYKPKQRSYRKTWGGGNFPGGSIPRTIITVSAVVLMSHKTTRRHISNFYLSR